LYESARIIGSEQAILSKTNSSPASRRAFPGFFLIILPAISRRVVWLIGRIAFETPPSPAFAGGTPRESHVIFLTESLARMVVNHVPLPLMIRGI
jgi:hypothetical protein